MGSAKLPNVHELQKPEPLHEVLAKDKFEDCMPCRIMGATTFAGLGVFSYFSGQNQLQQQRAQIIKSGSMFGMKSRQAGITTISLTLVGLGFWRLVN